MIPPNNSFSSSEKHKSFKFSKSLKSDTVHSSTSTSSKTSPSSSPTFTSAFAWLGPDREPFDIWTEHPYSEEPILRSRAASICDCLKSDCPGCFFPCSVCKNPQCSGRIREPATFVFDLFWDHRLRDICKYQIDNRGSVQSCKKHRDWVVYKVQDTCSSRARWLDPKKDESYKAVVQTVCTLPKIKSRATEPTASFFEGDSLPLPADAPADLTDPRDLAIDSFLRDNFEKRATRRVAQGFSSPSVTSSASASPPAFSRAPSTASNRIIAPPPAKIPRIPIRFSESPTVPKGLADLKGPAVAANSTCKLTPVASTASASSPNPYPNQLSEPIEIEDKDTDDTCVVIDDA